MKTVKELIEQLMDFNPQAFVSVVVFNHTEDFSIAWGNSEGTTKKTAEQVSFYVDRLCGNENVRSPQSLDPNKTGDPNQ